MHVLRVQKLEKCLMGSPICHYDLGQQGGQICMQKRPMGLEIEAPTPDKYEKGAGRLEGGTA